MVERKGKSADAAMGGFLKRHRESKGLSQNDMQKARLTDFEQPCILRVSILVSVEGGPRFRTGRKEVLTHAQSP